MTTVADEIARRFDENGVSHVFGYPGETSLAFYAALQRLPTLTHVVGRCPRGAAYAAEASARISGRVAVCDAPGGIGSPYTTPALLEAYNSGTPLLLLTSGPGRSAPRPWATGQVEHARLFESITKRVYVIREQRGALATLDAALALAEQPRRGPVVVEVAPDVLAAEADLTLLTAPSPETPAAGPGPVDGTDLTERLAAAARALRQGSSVAVVAGGGCHAAGAAEALGEFVRRFDLPVFTTLNGKGVLAEVGAGRPRVVGSKGDTPANEYISSCDVVVYVGSKMGDKSTNQYAWPSADQLLVRIDDDPEVADPGPAHGWLVRDDVARALPALAEALGDWSYTGGRPSAEQGSWSQSGTASLVRSINEAMSPDDVCVGEASVASGWFGALLCIAPPQRLITPRGTGSLGYALPASVGAAVARPGATVWTLVGDGGLAMSVGELETVARLGLDVKIAILDNGRLNLIDQHAIHHHDAEAVSRGFLRVDWAAVCAALGLPVLTCDDPDVDQAEVAEFLSRTGPAVLVLTTSTDEISPDMAIAIRKAH